MRTPGPLIFLLGVAAGAAACGSGTPEGPTVTVAVFTVSANPSQVAGIVCTRCGAGSTDRESVTTLTIQEIAGVAGVVTLIDMTLREAGTNAVIAAGSFDGAAVTQLAGTNRIAARGSLNVQQVGVHYAADQGGKSAVLTYIVRFTDDRGNQTSQTITVSTVT